MLLEKFSGCDGGDPGTPERPAIWLFGIEPGYSEADNREHGGQQKPLSGDYSIKTQCKWPFNRNAFKLLAALDGRPIEEWRSFAEEKQIFVPGSKGYFKGNLFPYACYRLKTWTGTAQRNTGFLTKDAYQEDCRSKRWPQIRNWAYEHRPSLIIAAGSSRKKDFADAFLGIDEEMKCHLISPANRPRPIYYGVHKGIALAVIPHLSRPLAANTTLKEAGEFLATLKSTSNLGTLLDVQ